MKEDKKILDKVNRNSGMTVPENYFADFAEKMMQNLPEKQEPIIAKPPTAWQRVRAYVYLVAMFAGIWCWLRWLTSWVQIPLAPLHRLHNRNKFWHKPLKMSRSSTNIATMA